MTHCILYHEILNILKKGVILISQIEQLKDFNPRKPPKKLTHLLYRNY